jgi:hypothetical protein
MSRSDRSLVTPAIIGLIAITAGVSITSYAAWRGPVPEQYEKPHAPVERYRATASPEHYAAYPVEDANDCYAAPNHDSADLCAQWRAAFAAEKAAQAAWWSVVWGVASFVLSTIGLGALLLTIKQGRIGLKRARKANEISREGNIAQQRAWLKILPPVVKPVWVQPGVLMMHDLTARAKNVGQSVALNTHAWARLFVVPVQIESALPYVGIPVPTAREHTKTIWPADDGELKISATGDGYSVGDFDEENAYFRIYLTIAVEYWSIFDNLDEPGRKTEATFELVRGDGNGMYTRRDDGGFSIRPREVMFAPNAIT